MKNKNNFSVIISTCDKFSDLWEANIHLINKNWADRNADTYLVSDKPTDVKFEGVSVVCAGENTEITQRLAYALKNVKTKYILFTLDDYFLTEPIDTSKILRGIEFMEKYDADYLRLVKSSKHSLRKEHATTVDDYKNIYIRNLDKGDYKVILYPGLWRTDFMKKTVGEVMNAWQYEVALTGMAQKLGAKCAVSNNNEIPFLDVIRKGKILRKANRYFKKHPIYSSDREIMRARDEWMITFKTFLRHWLPSPIFKYIKKYMMRRGHDFYSPIDEKN